MLVEDQSKGFKHEKLGSTQETGIGKEMDLCEFKANQGCIVRPCFQGKNKQQPPHQAETLTNVKNRIENADNLMMESLHNVHEVLF